MTDTEGGRKIAAYLNTWFERNDANARQLQQFLRLWCEEATAAGIPVARQVEMLNHYGVVLSAGGQGRDLTATPCPYCKRRPDGGHGGLCPNGSTGVNGEPGGLFSGGGGGGAIAGLGKRAGESQ